jgi:excisionase family DNA binding protein
LTRRSGMNAMDSLETISPQQAAAKIGVSANTVKKWCRAGLLRCRIMPGGYIRIRMSDLSAFWQALPDETSLSNSSNSSNASS